MHATPKRWTREEYYRLGESGILPPDARVELIDAVAPQVPDPSHSIASLTTRLVRLFGDTHYVRVQLPLDLTVDELLAV